MKKKKLIIASAVLGLLTLAVAAPYYAKADTTSVGSTSTGMSETNSGMSETNFRGHKGKNLTAAELTALKQKMEAEQAQRDVRQQAVSQAVANNDYNAWVAAVGATSPIAKKINADNFSQYVTLYNLEQQVIAQRKALGLDQPGHRGIGFGQLGK